MRPAPLKIVCVRSGLPDPRPLSVMAEIDYLGYLYLSLEGPQGLDTMTGMRTKQPERFVAYLRVSTEEQGRSGLGLEAQEAAVRQLVEKRGGRIIEIVREVQSGNNDERPELARATRLAARQNATLIVARLDRLARAVAKVAGLLRDGLKVRVADTPEASTFELHVRASLAEEERRLISERTKAALEAAKRRGVALGSAREGHWAGREDRRLAGARAGGAAVAERSRRMMADLLDEARPVIERNKGASLRVMAEALEQAGVVTVRGCSKWTATGVSRLIAALNR